MSNNAAASQRGQTRRSRSQRQQNRQSTQIKNEFHLKIYCQVLLFNLYTILLLVNWDQMLELYSLYYHLFCCIVANMVIMAADIVLMLILQAKVNQQNRMDLYTIAFHNITVSLFGFWGMVLCHDNAARIPGLFTSSTVEQT